MRHPRRRESRRWPAVALWSSCDPWAAARGPGGAQPSSPRGTDTRQGNAHACGGEHIRRSADLKRAPSNFSKSGRDGRHGAAAQHTHYGAVHMEAGQPRAIRSSSAPPGACSARSRAPHVLFSQFSPDFREGKLNYFPQSHTRQHSCFVAQHIVWANRTAHLHGASRGTDALVSFSLSCSDRP